jgi:hypothetical protein
MEKVSVPSREFGKRVILPLRVMEVLGCGAASFPRRVFRRHAENLANTGMFFLWRQSAALLAGLEMIVQELEGFAKAGRADGRVWSCAVRLHVCNGLFMAATTEKC